MTDRESQCLRRAGQAVLANELGLDVREVSVDTLVWAGHEEPWTRPALALAGEVALEVAGEAPMSFSEDREQLAQLGLDSTDFIMLRRIVSAALQREQTEVQALAELLMEHGAMELAE